MSTSGDRRLAVQEEQPVLAPVLTHQGEQEEQPALAPVLAHQGGQEELLPPLGRGN